MAGVGIIYGLRSRQEPGEREQKGSRAASVGLQFPSALELLAASPLP